VAASVDWMWESTAVTVLALAGIGALGARVSRPIGRVRIGVRAAIVLAALLAGAVQVPGALSTSELRASQAAERRGNSNAALAWANDAVAAEPWSASAYEQRGLVLEAAGRLAGAAADLRRAISHERTNYVHWLLLARIETEQGRLAAAARDYRQAHALRPVAAVFALAAKLPGLGTVVAL
jgi:tetratricopeptide (TPR) repeat protein